MGAHPPKTRCMVPRDFVFQVTGPDNQKLVEGHVSPKENESQSQAAQVHELRRINTALDRLMIGKQPRHKNRESESGQALDHDK